MPFLFNPLTGQLDIVTNADGDISALQAQVNALETRVDDLEQEVEQVQKVESSFTPASFALVVDQYIYTVTAATHGKTSPVATVYETNGSDFDEVTAVIRILANSDIQLIVPQTPDLRFTGKLVIL